MNVNRSEGMLLEAQPLRVAEEISRRMVNVQVVDGVLLLDADPTWAGAINTVLIKKGVRVNELRRVEDTLTSDTQEISTLGVPSPKESPYGAWSAWRRLLEAAVLPRSGHSISIACSRWRRCPGAKASSLTRLAAFLRRHSFCSIVRLPAETEKPPSNVTRRASVPNVHFGPDRVLIFARRSVTFAVPARAMITRSTA